MVALQPAVFPLITESYKHVGAGLTWAEFFAAGVPS